MARSVSDALLDMVEQDPRFTCIPAATVVLWLKLVRIIDRHHAADPKDEFGGLAWSDIAKALCVSEARLSLDVSLLVNYRLLERSYGGIGIPAELEALVFCPPSPPQRGFAPTVVQGGRQ